MEVCIFSTVNQIEADMLKTALDENNIDNYLKNYSANSLGLGGWTVPFGGANLIFGDIKVMVKEKDVDKALDIKITLFGDDEKECDTAEFEETEISSNDSENLNETQECYDTENKTGEDINNNATTFKGKKKSAKGKFLIFICLVLFVMAAFTIYSNISPQQKKDRVKAVTQYYYYEMFTIPKTEYNSISFPAERTWDSINDYRIRLRSAGAKLLNSTATASENDIFTLFTNSGYTPGETNGILSEINSIGNMIFLGEYGEDNNLMHIAYLEKL
jgi:hypothetical protein